MLRCLRDHMQIKVKQVRNPCVYTLPRSWSQASSLALVLALPCLGFGLQLAVTPVQQVYLQYVRVTREQVVSMLEEMKAKGTSEMAVEQQVASGACGPDDLIQCHVLSFIGLSAAVAA
eukprot:6365294-Amphidinium_carterae.1